MRTFHLLFFIRRLPLRYQFQQTGKARIKFFGAYSAAALKPVLPLTDQARFAQGLEVMGQRRLRSVEAKPPAGMVISYRFEHELVDDGQSQWVGERPHDRFETKVIGRWFR